MTKHPFNNDATPRERREALLKSGEASTFHQFGTSEADIVRDRHAEQEKSSVTAGAEHIDYPAGPNWSHDPVSQEPPLGYDVNAMEPVGTPQEVAASLGEATHLGEGSSCSLAELARLSGDAAAPALDAISLEPSETASPPSNDDDEWTPPEAA